MMTMMIIMNHDFHDHGWMAMMVMIMIMTTTMMMIQCLCIPWFIDNPGKVRYKMEAKIFSNHWDFQTVCRHLKKDKIIRVTHTSKTNLF